MEKPQNYHSLFDRDPAYGRALSVAVTVGIASLRVLRANETRKKALFINDSDTIIYLAKGPTSIVNGGIRLNAQGGSWEEVPDAMGYLWVGEYSAISAGANKTLLINEDS